MHRTVRISSPRITMVAGVIFSAAYASAQGTPCEHVIFGGMVEIFSPKEPGMASPATYQINVIGRFPDNWDQWFKGTIIRSDQGSKGRVHTTLTCQVIDQAELLGILNRLNNLNLPLLQVDLLE